MRPHPRRGLWTLATVAILLVYLLPIGWMISASLQPGVTSASSSLLPRDIALDGYLQFFAGEGLRHLQVSLIVALGSVVATLLIAIPTAYALSRVRSRFVGVALVLVLLAQMIPSVVLANAFYTMFATWGLLNSYLGLIIANATYGVPFAVILLRSFMLRLDSEVLEAAQLDGLGPFSVLVRIVLPLSRNAIVTAGVFAFLFAWGDLLFGLTLTTRTEMYPMTIFIYALSNTPTSAWAAVMAASLLTSIPALVVVLGAQQYIKAGLVLGSGR